VIRRQWFKVGSRPRARHRIQFKWIYAYGFVNPATGRTHWLLLPSVSCKLMEIALKSFAQEYVDEDTLVILLLDQAGFHQTGNMTVPEGIEFFPLPPYTPELQPAERLWPCLHEAMANRWVRTLDHLEELLTNRIRSLIKTPAQVQALTNFEWIHLAQNATN
jgi:transposase